jgi:hypothetical protein
MILGSVGCVEEANRSDLDSQADFCVCGKEALVFNYCYREVTVTGCDPEGETQSLRIISAALGYTIPQSGKTVLLIVHQSILIPTLNTNLLRTIQLRLHDVIVNETPKFQSLNLTNRSHSISVRGDNVDDVLVILLELYGMVSCFPTFKPTQEEFETCDRYELTYEYPAYDLSAKTFHNQEAGMMDSWGNLKIPGDFHPNRRQVCSLRQKEAELKLLSTKYSDTSAKLRDLSPVLDGGTLLAQLDNVTTTTDLNVSLVKSEMRDKAGVDAPKLAKNWGIGIEEAKWTRLVTTQRGIRRMIHTSLTKRYSTNNRQLRYRHLPVNFFTDTMYSKILSRQQNKAAQILSYNMGEGGVCELKRGVGQKMLHSGCPKRFWDDCIIRESYVRSHTSLDIFGLEGQVPEIRVKGEAVGIYTIS